MRSSEWKRGGSRIGFDNPQPSGPRLYQGRKEIFIFCYFGIASLWDALLLRVRRRLIQDCMFSLFDVLLDLTVITCNTDQVTK